MNADNLVGIYGILFNCPVWATILIILIMTAGVIYLGREFLEGLGYQVALSAKFGCYILAIIVGIAATILQRQAPILPKFLMNPVFQVFVLVAGFFFCAGVCLKTLNKRSGKAMDIYHDLIIEPMVILFMVTLLPVIYLGGTILEKHVVGILIAV